MKLREYQQQTIENIRDLMRQGKKRILVTLPTGSGKSIIMGNIAKRALDRDKKVLALMHRRQLVQQLRDRFESCGVESSYIMSGEETDLDSPCIIGTIQTYSRRIKLKSACGEFHPWLVDADVILLDEAHRSLSSTFQETLKKYPDKIVVGFTATPALSSGIAMGSFYEELIQPVSVKELIKQGSLVPARYFGLSSPDVSKVKVVAGDYEKKGLSKAVNKTELIGDIVTNWLKLANNKKTIVFAVNVKHSIAIMREFAKYEIPAEHLDAHSPDEKRQETLGRFHSGETRVLCNVDLYTEGTDIPDIECICLARPTKSIGRYIQMVGRGARPFKGKEFFLVLDHGANVNEHGFYEDPVVWTLDGKKVKYTKTMRKPEEKHPMECSVCGCKFKGDQCPMCLTKIENYGKKIEALEAELYRLKCEENKKKGIFTTKDKLQWVGMLRHEQERLNKTDKWLLAQYRSKFNEWPPRQEVEPIPANDTVKNYLKYQRIKWFKSRKRRGIYAKVEQKPHG